MRWWAMRRWRRRLLDLTLRNRLLAFTETKRTLRLEHAGLAELVEALSGGAEAGCQSWRSSATTWSARS